MHIAVTGATGFLGRYVVNLLTQRRHTCRCWHRPASDRGGFENERSIQWIEGGLEHAPSITPLLDGADAVVHAGLHRPPTGGGHRGADATVVEFAQVNLMGTLRLFAAAKEGGIGRFVFVSTCGVHDLILDDRPLDETHPLWPKSHYGAHKAALEKFVHSFGLPHETAPGAAPTHRHLGAKAGWAICALRPVGIYGIRRPVAHSKWFHVVRNVLANRTVEDPSGGKEVHAEDVARAVELLLHADADTIAGQSYNCCDLFICAEMAAAIAKNITGSRSDIKALNKGPRHQITSAKLQKLGMKFSGRVRLEEYVRELIDAT